MEIKATELDNKSAIIPLKWRSDGVAIKTIGNVGYITRITRNIEEVLWAIHWANTWWDLDRIFSLFTDEERIALQEYIEKHPERGFGNAIQDLLAKLTLWNSWRRFLRTIWWEELYRNSVILRIIIWLWLNGDVLANYLQSAEDTELHELVRLSKAFPETDFKRVYDIYFSKLPLDGIFRLWSQVCNGTYTSNNSSSDT